MIKETMYSWVIILMIALVGCDSIKDTSKTGYVDTILLNRDFEMKKELEEEYKRVTKVRQVILDSMTVELKQKATELDKKNYPEDEMRLFDIEREKFLLKQRQFEEDNQTLLSRYNEQVMSRINEYIEEYGKEHNYEYIFGANGYGSVMYANKGNDLTSDLTTYINKKYRGDLN